MTIKKITFNGYLNLNLQNLLKAREQFSLNWKSDGSQQKTFRTTLEVPYIFKSPLGLRAELNILKQDSTFQNTKTIADLSYYVKYDTRIYLGYQETNSSDIQNQSTNEISDKKSSCLTTELAYFKLVAVNPLFSNKLNPSIKTGIGKRQTNNQIENNS